MSGRPFDHAPADAATLHARQGAAIGNSWMAAAREAQRQQADAARQYVTEISVPSSADNDGWRLHARMLPPDPLPEPEPEPEPEAGR